MPRVSNACVYVQSIQCLYLHCVWYACVWGSCGVKHACGSSLQCVHGVVRVLCGVFV